MPQRPAKSAAELESMIMAELREYPACESAAVVVIGPSRLGGRIGPYFSHHRLECEEKLATITNRLRQQFDLAE
jgi:hypothetical protein